MNKFKTSVSNTLEKIQFKNIKVITVSAIAVSLFLMFLTITMPLSEGYSSGMAITALNLFTFIATIILLIFVSTNSSFNSLFVAVVINGVAVTIGFIFTIINFIDYISFYNKGLKSSSIFSESKVFFMKNMMLYTLDILGFIAFIVAIVFLLICIKKRQETNTKISFLIPQLILAVFFVISLVDFFTVVIFGFNYALMRSITNLVISASWVLVAVYLETRPKVTADFTKEVNTVSANANAKNNASLKDNKDYHFMNTNLVLHFFLVIVTCGIWNYVGIFKITRYLSSLNKDYYRDPITKLLLVMFIPFYSYYYYYKSGVIVDSLNRIPKGKSGTLLCFLSIFFPGASFLVLINKAQQLEYTMPPQENTQNVNSVQ